MNDAFCSYLSTERLIKKTPEAQNKNYKPSKRLFRALRNLFASAHNFNPDRNMPYGIRYNAPNVYNTFLDNKFCPTVANMTKRLQIYFKHKTEGNKKGCILYRHIP